MQHQVLDIRAGAAGTTAKLYTYIRDESPEMEAHRRPAVVICPGGGYGMTSDREAEPVALKFLEKGFQCFILRYSVEPVRFPAALLQLATAVAMVRSRADEWHVNADKIAVCGFSAGGHLAASLGVCWNREFVNGPLGLTPGDAKPNGMILCYPVITSGEFAHRGSFINLLGDRYEEDRALTSLENQVSADTPPTFLWHTWDDACVPVENSLLLATALRKNGVPTELHILPSGPHGLSLATAETGVVQEACAGWPDWATRWLWDL